MNKAKFQAQAARNEALVATKVAYKALKRRVKVKSFGTAVGGCASINLDAVEEDMKAAGDIPIRVTLDGIPCVRRYRVVG